MQSLTLHLQHMTEACPFEHILQRPFSDRTGKWLILSYRMSSTGRGTFCFLMTLLGGVLPSFPFEGRPLFSFSGYISALETVILKAFRLVLFQCSCITGMEQPSIVDSDVKRWPCTTSGTLQECDTGQLSCQLNPPLPFGYCTESQSSGMEHLSSPFPLLRSA